MFVFCERFESVHVVFRCFQFELCWEFMSKTLHTSRHTEENRVRFRPIRFTGAQLSFRGAECAAFGLCVQRSPTFPHTKKKRTCRSCSGNSNLNKNRFLLVAGLTVMVYVCTQRGFLSPNFQTSQFCSTVECFQSGPVWFSTRVTKKRFPAPKTPQTNVSSPKY